MIVKLLGKGFQHSGHIQASVGSKTRYNGFFECDVGYLFIGAIVVHKGERLGGYKVGRF
jgi:hypothetical protein